MKKKISSYVVLSIALVGCIIGMVFLGMSLFTEKTIKMQNLENMTKEQVLEWANKNEVSDLITYTYEYSEDVDEGVVISQSLEPKSTVDSNLIVCISKGSLVDINVNDYKTKKEFEDYIAQYPNVKVEYVNDTVHNENSEITKFSKNKIDIKNDQLTVFLSVEEIENEPEKENNPAEEKNDNKVLIPDNLLGMEEKKFIDKLNELGFKNLKKNTEKYYSFTSKKDTIYSYDDGKFDTNKTINYAISLGDYPTAFNAKEYNGLAKDKVDVLVKKYNDLNAHITLNTKNVETKDNKLVNTVNNCKCEKNGIKSIITCDIYTKEIETVKVDSFAGKSESEMLNALKAAGFTKFNKTGSKYSSYASGTIYSNDTGNKKVNETISYVVSLGQYVPNVNDFNGKTLNDAKNVANNYNNQGANVQITNPLSVEDNDHPNNTLFACSSTNTSPFIITCKLAVNVTKYTIMNLDKIADLCSGSTSYENSRQIIENKYRAHFPNLQVLPTSSIPGNPVIPYSVGCVYKVVVDGNENYDNGEYNSNVSFVVYIVDQQTN